MGTTDKVPNDKVNQAFNEVAKDGFNRAVLLVVWPVATLFIAVAQQGKLACDLDHCTILQVHLNWHG